MALEVFWVSGSGFSWRVLLALAHKNLPWQSHLLEFGKGDLSSPAYLAINPRGRVPALRDGEVIISESVAIMAYLDRRFPEPPLFGRTPAESGRIWQRTLEVVNYLDGPTEDFILPIYFGEVAINATKTAQLVAAVPRLRAEIAGYQAALAHGPWLCGAELSAADLAAYPMVKSVLRAAQKPAASAVEGGLQRMADEFPAVAGWMSRIEALPGYEATFPPHWRA
jgi:glutathione S-transferase